MAIENSDNEIDPKPETTDRGDDTEAPPDDSGRGGSEPESLDPGTEHRNGPAALEAVLADIGERFQPGPDGGLHPDISEPPDYPQANDKAETTPLGSDRTSKLVTELGVRGDGFVAQLSDVDNAMTRMDQVPIEGQAVTPDPATTAQRPDWLGGLTLAGAAAAKVAREGLDAVRDHLRSRKDSGEPDDTDPA